jgi:hypothetical protein
LVPLIFLGGVHGNDKQKLNAELCAAVEAMIELIHANGQEMPYPLGNKEFSDRPRIRIAVRTVLQRSDRA